MDFSPKEGENHIGRVRMQRAARNNLVLTDFFSLNMVAELQKQISYGGLYQQIALELIKGIHLSRSLSSFADDLIGIAEQSYLVRQIEAVEQASQILLNLPLPRPYVQAAQYYQALCIRKKGRYDEALSLLE